MFCRDGEVVGGAPQAAPAELRGVRRAPLVRGGRHAGPGRRGRRRSKSRAVVCEDVWFAGGPVAEAAATRRGPDRGRQRFALRPRPARPTASRSLGARVAESKLPDGLREPGRRPGRVDLRRRIVRAATPTARSPPCPANGRAHADASNSTTASCAARSRPRSTTSTRCTTRSVLATRDYVDKNGFTRGRHRAVGRHRLVAGVRHRRRRPRRRPRARRSAMPSRYSAARSPSATPRSSPPTSASTSAPSRSKPAHAAFVRDARAALRGPAAGPHRGEPAEPHPRRADDGVVEQARLGAGADLRQQERDRRRLLDALRRHRRWVRRRSATCPKLLVYALARRRNERAGTDIIPAAVLEKPPSAELRPDQRDDQSLPPYEILDPILEHVRRAATRRSTSIVADGFDEATVRRIDRPRRPRRVQAPAEPAGPAHHRQGVRPRPARADHQPLLRLTTTTTRAASACCSPRCCSARRSSSCATRSTPRARRRFSPPASAFGAVALLAFARRAASRCRRASSAPRW